MSRFCMKCGGELPENVMFCSNCGTKVTESMSQETTPEVSQDVPQEEVQNQTVEASVVQSQPQPVQAQPVQPQPVQPQVMNHQNVLPVDKTTKVVSTGAYFGLMLLYSLPIIGFIMCIIMAFAPKNMNIKNHARANLIWVIIGIVLSGMAIVAGAIIFASTGSFNELTSGDYAQFGYMFE